MTLTKDEFFERKIFMKQGLPEIKRQFPLQKKEIESWWMEAEVIEEYDAIQEMKSFLINKLKENCQELGTEYAYDGALLLRLFLWYKQADKKCEYCGLSEDQLEQLRTCQSVPYVNGRYPLRGKSLEIDRKISKRPYSEVENLVLACYWCNNAKTDTFTYEEFKQIGRAIAEVWKERLKS